MSSPPPIAPVRATLADLARTPGKAELIDGRIVHLMATGHRPNRVAGHIFKSLDDHAEMTGKGLVYTDNMGFAVAVLSSGRESFSPDNSYYLSTLLSDEMDLFEGPPTFAVEVRSKGDCGQAAEAAMTRKRSDYFEAGTLVVWDVDIKAEVVRVYRIDRPDQPTVLGKTQMADVEPAVEGWRMAVDRMFA